MSPVDLRLRQLEAQERKFGSGAGNAVHASKIGEEAVAAAEERATRVQARSPGRAASSSSAGSAGRDAHGNGIAITDEMFVVYMPPRVNSIGEVGRECDDSAAAGVPWMHRRRDGSGDADEVGSIDSTSDSRRREGVAAHGGSSALSDVFRRMKRIGGGGESGYLEFYDNDEDEDEMSSVGSPPASTASSSWP